MRDICILIWHCRGFHACHELGVNSNPTSQIHALIDVFTNHAPFLLLQLGNFETGQSVLTLTTPTLTPTTTRNIEDTLGHLLSDTQTDRVAGCAGFAVPKVLPNAIDVLGMGIPTGVSSLPLQQTFDLSLGQGSESEDSNASYNDTQMNEEQDTTDTCK